VSDSDEPLKPARPNADLSEARGYMPRVPWRWIVLGVAALVILGGGYLYRTDQKTADLRARIRGSYEGELAPVTERYRRFREKLEALVLGVEGDGPAASFADPRLRISALHRGSGLYLRLSHEQARTAEGIAIAAKDLLRDGIPRCIGISPISLRGLYETGEFLLPSYLEDLDSASIARLEVIEDDLRLRVERDLPGIATAMQAQYFLVVIQEGNDRSQVPSDVYLWDLRNDQLLLSVHAIPHGRLVPVRIALPGVETPRGQPALTDTILAQDCSIAAQVKEVAGEPAMDFGSEMPSEAAPSETPEGETPAEGTPPAESEDTDEPPETGVGGAAGADGELAREAARGPSSG
jgi:hypothetical protein